MEPFQLIGRHEHVQPSMDNLFATACGPSGLSDGNPAAAAAPLVHRTQIFEATSSLGVVTCQNGRVSPTIRPSPQ
jgi:hypothetical protein